MSTHIPSNQNPGNGRQNPPLSSSSYSPSTPPSSGTSSGLSNEAPEQVGSHLRAAGEHVANAARTAVGGLSEARSAVSDAVQTGISDAKPELKEAQREVRAAGDAAVESAERQWAKARDQSGALLHSAEAFIRERPLAAAGIAVAGGFLLSRLLRR